MFFSLKKKQTLGGDPGGGRSSTFLDSGTSGCQSCNTRPSRFRQACDTSFDNGRRCSSGTLLSLPFNPGLYILESIIIYYHGHLLYVYILVCILYVEACDT